MNSKRWRNLGLNIALEIPPKWSDLKAQVDDLDSDNWVKQVQQLALGTKKLAMINYSAKDDPESLQDYYQDLFSSKEEAQKFDQFQASFPRIVEPDGTEILYLPQFHRNAELLAELTPLIESSEEQDINLETVRSLLLGYSELSYLAYVFYQETLAANNYKKVPGQLDYEEFIDLHLYQILTDLVQAKLWILERGGSV